MEPEIQQLIDDPKLLIDYTLTCNHRGEPQFDVGCSQDLVPHTGIFKHLLVECRLKTFSQCIDFYKLEGYHY